MASTNPEQVLAEEYATLVAARQIDIDTRNAAVVAINEQNTVIDAKYIEIREVLGNSGSRVFQIDPTTAVVTSDDPFGIEVLKIENKNAPPF